MKLFEYKARDKSGQLIKGLMEAEQQENVATKLKAMGYVPIAIDEGSKTATNKEKMVFFQKVKPTEINMVTRLLWTLIKAGVPLVESLKAIVEQLENPILNKCFIEVMHDVEKGESLTQAMEKHPKIFNDLYIGMVRAGEASGALTVILERIAILKEKEEENRQLIKSATSYPILVLVAMSVGFFALAAFILPKFAVLYRQFTTTLPIPTRILLWLGNFLGHYWYVVILFFIGVILLVRHLLTIKAFKFEWDRRGLKIPIFGPLVLKFNMSRFARILSTLITAGIPITQAMDLVAEAISNLFIKKAIVDVKAKVIEGKSLHEPMREAGIFPSIVVQMVAIGEETGKMDELLINVADYYDFQASYTIKNLNTYIEPILLFIMGCGILMMALAMFLPMWNMVYLFKQ